MTGPNDPLVSDEGWNEFEQSLQAAAAEAQPAKPEVAAPAEEKPAEPEKPPAPEEKPAEPEKPGKAEPEKPAPEPEPEPEPEFTHEDLVQGFAGLDDATKGRVREALGIAAVAPKEAAESQRFEDDARVKALRESDDPGVRAVGEILLDTLKQVQTANERATKAEQRVAESEQKQHAREIEAHIAEIDRESHHLLSNFVIDEVVEGKSITRNVSQSHIDQALALLSENPGIAKSWTLERTLKAQFPGVRARASEPVGGRSPASKPAPPAQPTAVIVEAGATPSAPVTGPKPKTPAKSVSEAVDQGMEALFGLKPL